MTGMMAPQADGTMEEVPPGALPEEVADDIPAVVSEGEYIVPADVVRWHGLRSFMMMQMEAKEALSAMEEDGLIGGAPVAAGGGFAGAEPVPPEMMEAPPEAPIEPTGVQGFARGGTPLPDDYYTEAANAFQTSATPLSQYLEDMTGRTGYTYGEPGMAVTAGDGLNFAPNYQASNAAPIDYAALAGFANKSAADSGPVEAPEIKGYEGGGPGDDSGDPNHGAGVHDMDPNKSFGENLADWGGKVGFGLTAAGTMMSPMAGMAAIGAAAMTGKAPIDGTTKGTFGQNISKNISDITNAARGIDSWSSVQSVGNANVGGQTGFDQMDASQWGGVEDEIGFSGTNPGMAGVNSDARDGGSGSASTQDSVSGFGDHGSLGGPEDSIGVAGGWGSYSDSRSPGTSGGGGGADGNNGAGGSSDSRVICTHFYKKGELDRTLWAADTRWTMEHVSAHTQRGYQLWGVPYVRLMRKYKLAETIVRPLALHRAQEIAYQLGMRDKPDYIGKLGRVVLEGISWFAGWLPMEPISYKTLYTK